MMKVERAGALARAAAVVICLALVLAPGALAASPKVDLDLVGAEVADVFRALAELGEMNIVLDPAVRGTLTIRLHDLTCEEALQLVAYTTGVEYRIVGTSLIVTPPGKPSALDPVQVERFSLTHARVDDVMPVLDLLADNTKLQADPRTNSVIARGSAAALEQVRHVISMLDVAVAPPEAVIPAAACGAQGEPKAADESLEVVRLSYASAESVAGLLSLVVPSGKIQADSEINAIAMLADEIALARARQIIEQVDVAPARMPLATASGARGVSEREAPAETEALKLIKLVWSPAERVAEAVGVVVDGVRIGVDSRTNSLVVRACQSEMLRVEEIAALLDVPVTEPAKPKEPAPEAPEPPKPQPHALESFRLVHADAQAVQKALVLVVPAEAVQADTRTNSLLVFGAPDEMARAREMIALMDAAMPAAAVSIAPAADVAMAAQEPEPDTLRAVVLEYADPLAVRDALGMVVPRENIIIDHRTSKVIVLGKAAQHAQVEQIIAMMDVPAQAEDAAAAAVAQPPAPAAERTVHAFRVAHADPADVREALALVVPRDAVHVDLRTQTALVLGLPDEIALAGEIVALLDTAPADAGGEGDLAIGSKLKPGFQLEPESALDVIRVVRLEHAVAAEARAAIASAIPEVSLTADARTNSLIVVGPAGLQSQVDALVAALDVSVDACVSQVSQVKPGEAAAEHLPEPEPETAEVVRLEYAAPAAVRQALAPTLPESKMSVDERTASIVIVGTAAQREQARRIIAQLDVEVTASADEITAPVAPADPEVLQVFKLSHAPASRVREALAPVVAVDSMTVDERTNSLIVSASRSRVARAAEVIERLDVEVGPAPGEPGGPRVGPEAEVATYRPANAPADSLRSAVGLLVAQSDIEVDSRTNTLLVRAVPLVQQRVAELVRGLDVPVVPAPAPKAEPALEAEQPEVMRVFRLTHAAASDMKALLGMVAPAAKMQPDDRTRSLIVMAPATTLATLDELVRMLDIPAAPSAQADAEAKTHPDPVITRVYRLNHAVPGDVAKALEGLVKGAVKADARTCSLVIEAAESEHARALSLLEALDRELPQVLIEARLEELSGDAGQRLGLDWSFGGLSFGQNAYGQWVSVSLDFLTNLTALEEQGKASLISRQHTFTVSGKTGKILIGDRIPVMIQEVQEGVAVAKLEFINAGIELSITPTVSEDGTITAVVKPVISSIVGWTPQNYPQIRTRELETMVSLKTGQTAVIGGMLHRDEIESLAKVPIIGEIPLLGALFTKRSVTTEDTEIVVMITAWQVNPGQRPVAGPATSEELFPVRVEDAPSPR